MGSKSVLNRGLARNLKQTVQFAVFEGICLEKGGQISNSPQMGSKSGKMSDSHACKSMKERYEASMVLSGVGDALGFKNGGFEFCHSGAKILEEVKTCGGFENLRVKLPNWMVSDDTVMHLATADALCLDDCQSDRERLLTAIAQNYKTCMNDMSGRAPGQTCMSGAFNLKPSLTKGYQQPFNPRGGGCGAAMRAMCIGLRYSKPEELGDLISVSVESGRMTHHHPVGFLGAMAAALFTAYSIQGKPVREWGLGLLQTTDKAREYVSSSDHAVQQNLDAWSNFTDPWKKYLSQRGILDGQSQPVFPEKYDVNARDAFYKSISYSGWGGASGHDAPMIAYDALLYAFDDWKELCERAMFHGGDSDSTGVIAGACYGAKHGFDGVPKNHYKNLEYRERLEQCGKKLFALSKREDLQDSP